MSPKFGWGLSTVPQPHLNGRRVPLPRGRVIGGTGSINGMAYFRGPAKDFDDWAAMGNPGWSYADLLPYFLRSENNPEYAGSPYHATGGPMGVSFPTSRNPLCDAFNASMASLGFKEIDDFNVPDPNGYGYRQGTIWKGWRVSTASAYLEPALGAAQSRGAAAHARAARAARRQARGRRRDCKRTGRDQAPTRAQGSHRLRRHVPLAAPASAFGHRRRARSEILGHHAAASSAGRRAALARSSGRADRDGDDDSTSYGHSWKALPRNVAQSVRYLATRRGQFASNLFETTAYIRTLPQSDRPDLQIVFQPARRNPKPFPIPLGHGYAIVSVCTLSEEHGPREPVGPGPARRAADRSRARQRRGGSADDSARLEDGARRSSRTRRSRSTVRTKFSRDPRSRPTSSGSSTSAATLTTVHHPGSTCRMGSGRRQRRRPRAQGARARAASGRRCLDLSAPRRREHERERRRDRGEGVRHDPREAGAGADRSQGLIGDH